MTDRSDLGRALAALRPHVTRICEACGTSFEAVSRAKQPARTCSNRCRQQLHRQAKKARPVPSG